MVCIFTSFGISLPQHIVRRVALSILCIAFWATLALLSIRLVIMSSLPTFYIAKTYMRSARGANTLPRFCEHADVILHILNLSYYGLRAFEFLHTEVK